MSTRIFSNILVPLDFTERNERALEAAAALALQNGARVELLHVIETIKGIPFDELRGFYERLENEAREKLRPAVSRLEEAGIAVSCSIAYGKRPEEIILHARSSGSDLIVLSSHTFGPDDARSPGSISYKVGLLAPCSVLLVRDTHPGAED